jgi:nucleoid-associated protein YgaU
MQADLSLTLLEHNGANTAGSPALASQLSTVVAVLTQSGVQVPSQLSNLIQQLPSLLSSGDSAGLVAQVTAEIAAFISGLPSNATGAAQVVDVALPELLQVLGSLGGSRTYVVREGDTMARIAARELGDYRKAEVIAMLNGIRDWAAITPNQTLRLP